MYADQVERRRAIEGDGVDHLELGIVETADLALFLPDHRLIGAGASFEDGLEIRTDGGDFFPGEKIADESDPVTPPRLDISVGEAWLAHGLSPRLRAARTNKFTPVRFVQPILYGRCL